MTEGFVNRIIDQSFIDGPGSRTAIFLQGCNMGCLYCHNPETQNLCIACGDCVAVCPTGALGFENGIVVYDMSKCAACDRCLAACTHFSSPKTRKMTGEELAEHIAANAPFLDGVTFSGGECTLQGDFITDVFQKLKAGTSLTCFVDTNGLMEEDVLRKLIKASDGFMFDLKAFTSAIHKELTGVSNDIVFRNLKTVSDSGLLYEIRTVLVEGYTDREEEIARIAGYVKKLNDYTLLKLIPFRPFGVRTKLGNTSGTSREMCEKLYCVAAEILGERAVLVKTALV